MTNNTPCYGATIQEWGTLDVLMGLTADLLPVVANPKAVVSPDSKMKDKGKVPSHYNRHGHVVGIPEWTRRIAADVDIERWSAQRDYGICLQTRTVRALDIDVPDAMLAERIEARITEVVGYALPRRYRTNSAKCLLAFRLPGDMPKRVAKVREKIVEDDGNTHAAHIIEFLATGQQFIAAGTHGSGARIQWDWHGHEDFPTLTLAQFEAVWAMLVKEFACSPSSIGSLRQRGEHFETADPTAKALYDKGLALDIGNDGQLFVECPWKDEHSMDSGITECAYFPRGTNGYDLGHFKCLHASHADKSDTDFEEALGLRDDMFDLEEPAVALNAKGDVVRPLPGFERDKTGGIKPSLYNLGLALERDDICAREIKYDIFLDEDMIRMPGKSWRSITDGDLAKLRRHLERRGFRPIGKEIMRDALNAHGDDFRFDSAIEWLENLEAWDGVPRIDSFLVQYFGTEDTPYATAVGRYLWSALAGRTLKPGVKADMAVILQGEQGVIKSTAIAALAPCEDQFGEICLGDKEADLARSMRGKTVIELGELRGFYSKEFEGIKAWIVRRFDEWIPKFKERRTKFYRRCVFIGTTNHIEFLIDETGNRRFLPISVLRAAIDALRRDRNQLWAEARDLFMAEGICWQDAERLAKDEHDKFTVRDSWEENIASWLQNSELDGGKPGEREYLKLSEVMYEALNIDARITNSGLEKRASKVLKGLGYERARVRVDGKPTWVFRMSQKIAD